MTETKIGTPDRTTLVAFLTVALLGGINLVAVKFSNQELAPLFGAGARFGAASLLLVAVVAARRIPVPRGRALVGAIIYGTLGFAGFYALGYWALLELSAGVAAVVLASVPLLTLLLASLHRVESLSARGLVGATLAVAGIAILVSGPTETRISPVPLLAALGAAAVAAESGVALKMFPPSHPVATNAIAMGIGAVLLLVASAIVGEAWRMPAQRSTWVAFAYLVVLGSVGLFGLFLFTLKRWTASGVSYLFVLMPVVASGAAWLLLGEPITPSLVAGGAVVVGGIYVGALWQGWMRGGEPAPAEEPAPA